jgi:hypothetical protein
VTGDQLVVDTGATKIGVPLVGFGKDEKGLVLNMTAAKFKEAIAKALFAARGRHQVELS